MGDFSVAELPYQIALALSLASSSTGADYDYLLKTAQRESSLQIDAKARDSTATGLFQFIEETWIRTIAEEGDSFGLTEYTKLIKRTSAGRYYIPDAADRQRILDLRKDPHISALIAGVFARRNADLLSTEIGRKPTAGELYIAHFLGPLDAVRLVKLRNTQQHLSAPDLFPRAAEANALIFYADGKPRSIGQVYDVLIRRHDGKEPVSADAGRMVLSVGEAEPVTASSESSSPFFAGYSFSEFFSGRPRARAASQKSAWVATTETATEGADGTTFPTIGFKSTVKSRARTVANPLASLRGSIDEGETVEPAAAVSLADLSPAPESDTGQLKIIHVGD